MLVFISKIRFAVALTFIEWYLYVAHQLVLAMLRYFLPSRKLTALVYVAQIYKAVQQSQRNIIERLYHCQFTQQLVHLLRVTSFYVVIVAEIVKELFP